MSIHIGASPGDIAPTVLIAGDPMRARFLAEQMLSEVKCYNQVRGMLGFTGWYRDKRISVQGTGIGIPSTAIYVYELIHSYDVTRIMRIGTCGALQPDLRLDQIILATGAHTDSNTQLRFHPTLDSGSRPDFALLEEARNAAIRLSIDVREGPVFSTDTFYDDDNPQRWDRWRAQGLLAVEMETSILYNLAERYGIEALSILSVSDNVITGSSQNAQAREEASQAMMELALEIA